MVDPALRLAAVGAADGDVVASPPISEHRLVSDGRSTALIRPDAEIDWWCAPDMDSPPLLWSLLDERSGGRARWAGARLARAWDGPAGPAARTTLVQERAGGRRFTCWDGLVEIDGTVVLARLVRGEDGDVGLTHQLRLGGFDSLTASWSGTVTTVAGNHVWVSGGASMVRGNDLCTSVVAPSGRWAALVVGVGPQVAVDAGVLADRLATAGAEAAAELDGAKLPRHHPERAADALAVLRACTFRATGAAVAAVTTSLPEAVGGDRQWDYRYSWLRDASLGVSVAALLGQRAAAQRYLAFVREVVDEPGVPGVPLTDVRGEAVPAEREVAGVAGWAGSQPVRVGNDAARQLQYDGLGLVLEAISVYLQTGGSLDGDTWATVRRVADGMAAVRPQPSSGIWELRQPRPLVSADIGRWLALDRALWVARGWRPGADLRARRRWKQARHESRERVLAAVGEDGSLPQWYGQDPPVADASALMIPIFGMLEGSDPRAALMVDWTLRRLEAWPWLYRYEPGTDGLRGREGAFVPVSWWAADALAVVGRLDEAQERVDAMCSRSPRLLAEEVDPETGSSLGNVPLVWSHAEAARTMYLLDAAVRRRRWGPGGLWAWRLARYASLRWGGR